MLLQGAYIADGDESLDAGPIGDNPVQNVVAGGFVHRLDAFCRRSASQLRGLQTKPIEAEQHTPRLTFS